MAETWNLVGDVGGTHARFALCRHGHALEKIKILSSADFNGLEPAISHYLESVEKPKIGHAAIGMANPVVGDHVQMTNLPWNFSIEKTQAALGLQGLHIINDFKAQALSLSVLPADELIEINRATAAENKPRALVGPGTGLGVSGLVPDSAGRWIPIAGEGGHVNFAPATELELALWQQARQEFDHVSMERLVSGSGLEFIYQTLCRLGGATPADYSPADISKRAIANTCEHSRQALDTFCAILGTVASDVTLTLGARGGLYIGGGIVPKLGDYFARSPFRARFVNKGRFSDYLAQIPVFVIDSPYAGLSGAAVYLENASAHL